MFSWFKFGPERETVIAYPPAPDGVTIYAIGDIHGCDRQLSAIHQRIDADLARRNPAAPVEVYLGDYIDRGPGSAQVLDRLIDRAASRQAVFLRGNHETYIDDFLNGEVALAHWQSLGGYETLMSYGINAYRMLREEEGEPAIRKAFAAALPDRHRTFLASLSNQHFIGRYQFVHAGVRPGIAPEDQAEEDLLWIRDAFLNHDGDFGYCVVHGHTPVRKPEFRPNRINIDTGAFATGVLTCIRIDETGAHLLEGDGG